MLTLPALCIWIVPTSNYRWIRTINSSSSIIYCGNSVKSSIYKRFPSLLHSLGKLHWGSGYSSLGQSFSNFGCTMDY